MATAEQMQQMLELMQQQMKTVTDLQAENARLREEGSVTVAPGGADGQRPYSAKKLDRPIVNASIGEQDWVLFLDKWDRYKRMCRLRNTDVESICLELRESCSSDLNKLLFEYVGASKLEACNEAQLLQLIKSIAVKTVHKEVHRMAFHAMFQEEGEPVTQWVARLNSKACQCKFVVPCTCCTPALLGL